MKRSAPPDTAVPDRWSAPQYLRLVETGVLGPRDRVELVEGVIVAMSPQNVPHASGVTRVERALHRAVGDRAVIRVQLPFVVGRRSVPEPDAIVASGSIDDYDRAHPSQALLVVEVADSSSCSSPTTSSPHGRSSGR